MENSLELQLKYATLRIDERRAEVVFRQLTTSWRAQSHFIPSNHLPQHTWQPPGVDAKKLALWFLYNALLQRGPRIAEDTFTVMQRLYEADARLFDPTWVHRNLDFDSLKAILIEVESGRHVTGATNAGVLGQSLDDDVRAWLANSEYVARELGGDLLRLFEGVENFETVFVQSKLVGFRRKLFSLLVIWLQEYEMISHFACPIPIDFHALRLMLSTRVIEVLDCEPFDPATRMEKPESCPTQLIGMRAIRITDRIRDWVAMWSENFLTRTGIDHVELNPAIWLWGRNGCTHQFQNRSSEPKGLVMVTPDDVRTGRVKLPRNYDDVCSRCPFSEGLCTYIPGWWPYYRLGLMVLNERTHYPHQVLPGMEARLPGRKLRSTRSGDNNQSNPRAALPGAERITRYERDQSYAAPEQWTLFG